MRKLFGLTTIVVAIFLGACDADPALVAQGRPEAAGELVGAVQEHASLAPPPSTEAVRAGTDALLEDLEGILGEERFAQLRREGAALPVEQVVHRTRQALNA